MEGKPNRALLATTAAAAAIGCIATWKLYSQWKALQKRDGTSLPELASKIDAKDLAILSNSSNTVLKRSAEQVLVDRMMSEPNLQYLLKQCCSVEEIEMKKAITVLSILTKTNEFKPCLIKKDAFKIVAHCLNSISDGFQITKLAENCFRSHDMEQILKYSVIVLHDLVSNSEANLTKFFNCSKELVAFLLEIISDSSDSIIQDVRRLCVLILQQMMHDERMRLNLISYGMIHRTTLCFLRTIGDAWLSRNCLQILVMYINFFEAYLTEEFLQEMSQLGIVPVLIGCLKSDDSDLVYWSTALIHEFLLRDLHKGIISKIPNIIKTFYHILISSESGLQRLVLRMYCFLSIDDNNFKMKLLNFKPLLKRISVCLASGNDELVYWALLLVQDLSSLGIHVAAKLLKANKDILNAIIALSRSNSNGLCDFKLIVETLGFFCSCESLHKTVVEAGCIKEILTFLQSDRTDLQLWASSLLLNLAMTSEDARERIIKDGGCGALLKMAVEESEMPQLTSQASKTLVMLGFTDASLDIALSSGDDSSIRIDNKEYSPMKFGINMVRLNVLNFRVSKGKAFDPSSPSDLMNFLLDLNKNTRNELIMITTQGGVNKHLKDESLTALRTVLEKYGLDSQRIEDGDSWCLLAQVEENHQIKPIRAEQQPGSCNLQISLSLAHQVNNYVRDDLLKPFLSILMSMPAKSNISKVSELEIISTLARHEDHQDVMLSTAGFLDYVSELIWCFACINFQQLSTKPLMIAHCVGALKIVHSLSTNSKLRDKLIDSPVLGAIKSFLLTTCDVFISELLRLSADGTRLTKKGLFSASDDVFEYNEMSKSANMAARVKKLQGISVESQSDAEIFVDEFYVDHSGSSKGYPTTNIPEPQDNLSRNLRLHEESSVDASSKQDEEARTNTQNDNDFVQKRTTSASENLEQRPKDLSGILTYTRKSENDNARRSVEEEDVTDFDEFEEEDLPVTADNDEDDFTVSQGRAFFDIPRSTSVQRSRSASLFNPNDWPSTRSGCLSRAISEAARRSKSPLKDIAADLEDLDDALQNMTNYALMMLYFCLKEKPGIILKDNPELSKLLHLLWCVLLSSKEDRKPQFGIIISSIISKFTTVRRNQDGQDQDSQQQNDVRISQKDTTSSMIMSNDWLEIYNGNWTFESACGECPVSRHPTHGSDNLISGWYYEVLLQSNGIMQIGWASKDGGFNFEPERGLGVGDSLQSIGFDGGRCKIWTGPVGEDDQDNKFGRKWEIGDTLSCLLSVNGQASFWLNGQDLGVAADNLNMTLSWYPAVSLSLDQQCRLNFGNEHFNYDPPVGYISIQENARLNSEDGKLDFAGSGCSVETISKIYTSDVDVSNYSKDGSSYSSYDVIENSMERDIRLTGSLRTSSRAKSSSQRESGSRIGFSPRDLIDTTGFSGRDDIAEVMYYEMMIPRHCEQHEIEFGYQSTVNAKTLTGMVRGRALLLPVATNSSSDDNGVSHCEEVVGCGLLWPSRKVFFTADGIGIPFTVDLQESGQMWPETLDEIVPYFSMGHLQINFGQTAFLCQPMNSITYRKHCSQVLYDIILRSEEPS